MPHVYGKTDAAVAFGSAWSQCEDHFWQLEDTYVQALGRYAEIVGEKGLESDIEVAAFELVESARDGLRRARSRDPAHRGRIRRGLQLLSREASRDASRACSTRMEPWHVLLFERFTILEPPARRRARSASTRARGPRRRAGGLGRFESVGGRPVEDARRLDHAVHQSASALVRLGHVHRDARAQRRGPRLLGLDVSRRPLPHRRASTTSGLGLHRQRSRHLRRLSRSPSITPTDPLLYRYGDGWRRAEEWTPRSVLDSQRAASGRHTGAAQLEPRRFTLRKSHYGPVMAREDATHWLAVRVPKLHSASRMSQSLAQAKARNFAEWRAAAARLDLQTLNTMYADADGNIYYLYNGAIPKRDPAVDWTQPVDGADPRFEWNGFHSIDELPQVLNPPSGYVQNCNSSPFTTTDDGNPSPLDFPSYMAEDRFDDKRRAKMSRYLLRGARDLTFDGLADSSPTTPRSTGR